MKKQVVFIMVDTQSADMLGAYGNEHLKTPNLDELAKEGYPAFIGPSFGAKTKIELSNKSFSIHSSV